MCWDIKKDEDVEEVERVLQVSFEPYKEHLGLLSGPSLGRTEAVIGRKPLTSLWHWKNV